MDIGRLVGALLRRWLIVAIGFVVSVGAAAAVFYATPRMYQSTSQVMVLLPRTANSPDTAVSPFLYMPDGLTTLARVVVLIPNTAEFRSAMVQDGYYGQYEVSVESTNPIVRFSVEGANPELVLATRDELMARFEDELKRVQNEEQVPGRQFAHVRYLEASTHVDPVTGDRLRAAAAAGALGAMLTLLTIILLERGLVRSPRGRRAKAESPDDVPGTPRRADTGAETAEGIEDPAVSEPDGTTSEPDGTTPEPDSTPEPDGTTSEPDGTTPEPDSTTPEPDSTTPETNGTTPEPDPNDPDKQLVGVSKESSAGARHGPV